MPIIFGTNVTGGSYNKTSYVITATGEAFGENKYTGVSNIEVSKTGLGTWTAVTTIDTWSDTSVVGTLAAKLTPGKYDIRVTSSDGETDIGTGVFKISGGGMVLNISMVIHSGVRIDIGY